MEKIKELIRLLRQKILVIIAVALVFVTLTVGYFYIVADPAYRISTTLLVHRGYLTDVMTYTAETESKLVDTCVELLDSQKMYNYIIDNRLPSNGYDWNDLDEFITVKRKAKDSLFIEVTVTTSNPYTAAIIADAFIESAPEFISGFAKSVQIETIYLSDQAEFVIPHLFTLIISGFLCGGILSSFVIVLAHLTNRRFRGSADFKNRYSHALLGSVPDFRLAKRRIKK